MEIKEPGQVVSGSAHLAPGPTQPATRLLCCLQPPTTDLRTARSASPAPRSWCWGWGCACLMEEENEAQRGPSLIETHTARAVDLDLHPGL